MIKIIPYNRELMKGFVYNGVDIELSGEDIIPVLDYYAVIGDVYMGIIDDKVIAIGGVYPLWSGNGGCFLFINKESKKYKLGIFKAITKYLRILLDKYGIKNLMIQCQKDKPEADRLIRHLGFEKINEIVLASYTQKRILQ